MTAEEIFPHLFAHLRKGLMIHDQLAQGFGFLNLCGYQKCHEYHFYEESRNYHKLMIAYLENYNKLVQEEVIEVPHIIPPSWYNYTRMDVDPNTKKNSIKDFMKKWIDWEEETKKLLMTDYKILWEQNDICGAIIIKELLEEVNEELIDARDKRLNLEAINYDMPQIISEQKNLCELYKHK